MGSDLGNSPSDRARLNHADGLDPSGRPKATPRPGPLWDGAVLYSGIGQIAMLLAQNGPFPETFPRMCQSGLSKC